MYIIHDPDKYVAVNTHTSCAFHRANPGVAYAGCTCMSSYGLREATPSEEDENRRNRLIREKNVKKFFKTLTRVKK